MSESIKPEPLDYGPPSSHSGAWSQICGWFGERVAGFAEFVGILIGIAVTTQRLVLAIGMGFFALGLGQAIELWPHGPAWMFCGAILIGLSLPLRK